MNYATGFILSALIVVPSVKRDSLTNSGGLAALGIGGILYGLGGPEVFFSLIAFFLSASFLPKVFNRRKEERITGNVVEKGSRRDHIQVLANGGPAFLMILLYNLLGHEALRLGAVMTLAAANADTWASELGVLSASTPVYIIKKTPVPKGISGGVTKLGFLASFLGGFFIAVIYILISFTFNIPLLLEGWKLLWLISIVGFLGSLLDSVIGELWQALYQRVSSKGMELTEKRKEEGRWNTLDKGYALIDNNMVNFLSTLTVAFLGVLALLVF